LVKYCTSCGKDNEDPSVFCIACGQGFPSEAAAYAIYQQQQQVTASPPVLGTPYSSILTIEQGRGPDHKHSSSDLYCKDANGKILLVARMQSLLHRNYALVDENEVVTGFIEPKRHLTNVTLSVEDSSHLVQGTVQISSIRGRGIPPKCSIEGPSSENLGSLAYSKNILSFSLVKVDGSRVFDASLASGSGVRQFLTALAQKAYTINLFDPNFSLPMLLAIFAAIDAYG
jgi:hypothetical protein